MTRKKAFLTHLAISVSVLMIFASLVFWVWYPSPFLKLQGGFKVLTVLLSVDVILGPLMTLILFKPGKKGLRFDITVVALTQAAAFLYGASVIHQERPVYLAFIKDRFELITAGNIDFAALRDQTLDNRFGIGPRRVYVELPEDPKLREQVMFESISGGKDYSWRPEYYRPFPGPAREIRQHALNLERFTRTADHGQRLDGFLARHGLSRDAVILFPVIGREESVTAVLRADDARWIGMIDADPYAS